MTVAQEEAASKEDIKRLDGRIDRLEDRMERGFASVHDKLDKLNLNHLRTTLALAALIVAVNRWG